MTSKNCEAATEAPDHRWFNPACLYCGARYIQLLGRRPLTREQCQAPARPLDLARVRARRAAAARAGSSLATMPAMC